MGFTSYGFQWLAIRQIINLPYFLVRILCIGISFAFPAIVGGSSENVLDCLTCISPLATCTVFEIKRCAFDTSIIFSLH